MVETWQKLGVDVFVMARKTWCEGTPSGLGYAANPPPPEESLGGSGVAGWNGIDEFGRRWKHGRYVGGAIARQEDLRKYSPEPRLNERYDKTLIDHWNRDYPDYPHVLFSHTGPLGLTIECFGFIEFCYALFDKRALIEQSVESKTEWFIETSKYAVDLGVDFVIMGDDMGFKGHGYVSPSDFKNLPSLITVVLSMRSRFPYSGIRKAISGTISPWQSKRGSREFTASNRARE